MARIANNKNKSWKNIESDIAKVFTTWSGYPLHRQAGSGAYNRFNKNKRGDVVPIIDTPMFIFSIEVKFTKTKAKFNDTFIKEAYEQSATDAMNSRIPIVVTALVVDEVRLERQVYIKEETLIKFCLIHNIDDTKLVIQRKVKTDTTALVGIDINDFILIATYERWHFSRKFFNLTPQHTVGTLLFLDRISYKPEYVGLDIITLNEYMQLLKFKYKKEYDTNDVITQPLVKKLNLKTWHEPLILLDSSSLHYKPSSKKLYKQPKII